MSSDDKPQPSPLAGDATEVQREALETLPVAARQCPELRWISPSGDEHTFTVDGRATLGSSPQADITVADRAVSRLHAQLELQEDGLWIHDVGSQNGTSVEGVRVKEARLEDGSRCRVGSTTITVRFSGDAKTIDTWPVDRFGPLFGRSVAMREMFMLLSQAAASSATLLVEGETGTGKELAAQAVHEASPRANEPFVVVDCGAVHEGLIEAELFGHTRGAFTGASNTRPGAVEEAEGGTLFLDEIGELPLALQPKLLRLIESRTVQRLGESKRRPVDVRFLAATHRDLGQMVNDGTFREDLYFRLAVLRVKVPPLRHRLEDIPLIVEQLLPEGANAPTTEVLRELQARRWPGNVRELRNAVERALVFGPGHALEAQPPMRRRDQGPAGEFPEVPLDVPFKEVRDQWTDYLEVKYVSGLLDRHGGNVSAVAQAAGLSRTYVHRLIRKHGI